MSRIAAIAVALVLGGCEMLQPQPEPARPQPKPVAAPAAPAAVPVARATATPVAPAPDRPGLTMANYQKEIADAIVRTSADETFNGKLPPLLRSVVVLQVAIDAKGMPSHVTMFRSNGFTDLEKRAIAAVYRAAPYPIPGRTLLAGHANVTFTESFLFRNDGRFQVRTVAEQQSTEFEPRKSTAQKADCCKAPAKTK